MSNELQIFTNSVFGEVRVTMINDEPWFSGKDVVQALGYKLTEKKTYTEYVKKYVNEKDRMLLDKNSHVEQGGVDYRELGQRGGYLINEPGLYALVLGSEIPSAKDFKQWVTDEVLPSIRKHGVYVTQDVLDNFIADPDTMIKVLTALKEERTLRIEAEEKVKEAEPKITFADAVAKSDSTILVRELAILLTQNNYKIGEKRLYTMLRNFGYLVKDDKSSSYNLPTQWSAERGLFSIKETVITSGTRSRTRLSARVTGAGQLYFLEKFRQGKLNPTVLTPPVKEKPAAQVETTEETK